MDLFGEEIVEEEPEVKEIAEEPEGPQTPRTAKECLGHNKIEETLMEQFQSGRMPHGLIFSGPKGIGKTTFAYRLARQILNNEALIASGGHPDLLTIERAYDAAKDEYKGSVAVDEVRKVNPFLRMTASYENGWRVVIIDDADTMNRNAQNALLKILEEPPANTVLILICHRLGALIPTIRSRTRTITFNPLSREIFDQLLVGQGYELSPAQYETLYKLSEGSIGIALEHIEQGGLDTLTQILGALDQYPSWSWPDLHVLADQLSRSGRDQSYSSFTKLLPWVFSQMITAKARGQAISSQVLQISAVETLHRQSSLESLLKICENLKSHFERVERSNLDKRQAVLGAFSIIGA